LTSIINESNPTLCLLTVCFVRVLLIQVRRASASLPLSPGYLKGNDAFLQRFGWSFTISEGTNTLNNSDPTMRLIQDQMDDLDVRIALRDYEEAVRGIEKGTPSMMSILPLGKQTLNGMDPKQPIYSALSHHLSHRTQQLAIYLSHSLNIESNLPLSVKRYSHLLIRLGEENLARATYLRSRSAYILQKVRSMQHPGAYGTNDVNAFMEAISWLLVRLIKNSWIVYNETFSENRMASSFFEWVKKQVEGIFVNDPLTVDFGEIFRRQLFGYSRDSPLYVRTKEDVMEVWSELKGLGLDMSFMLELLMASYSEEKEDVRGTPVVNVLQESVEGLSLET
jgi:hypothetical protein